MAIRNLLHENHLEDFKEWLTEKDWVLQSTKGDFEVLRAKRNKNLLLVYDKIGSKHFSFEDKHLSLVLRFLRERKNREG